MKVVVAGELPLVWELGQLIVDAGHDTHVYVAEDFHDAWVSGQIMEQAEDAGVAIEVQNESAEAKQELLAGLVQILSEDTLILSSALPVSATEAASWVPNPGRLAGFGLLSPISAPGSVELANAMQTEERYLLEAQAFWKALDMEPVLVADGPGLVRARIICCLINEAAAALLEGVASVEDIDAAMRLGTNYPYGPLEWADTIGLDTVLGVVNGLFREWGEDRYRPSPLLKRMVLAGRLGKKTGRGFYRHEQQARGRG